MTTYTAEETAGNRAKWVAALRSGEFRQGRDELRNDDGEYCCLGVATQLGINEGTVRVEDEYGQPCPAPADWSGYEFWDEELPAAVVEWLGLASSMGSLVSAVGTHNHLIALNDDAHWDFNQIADLIESGGVKLAGESS